jgi:hypothetical protein
MHIRVLLLLSAIFVFTGSESVFAQFRGGFTAGINSSAISGGDASSFRQFGLGAGPFVNYVFSETDDLHIEMLFSQKGARKPQKPDIGDFSFYLLRLNYIELPLLYRHRHNRYLFEAGPSVSYLISMREEDAHGQLPLIFPYRPYELAVNLGISYEINEKIDMNWRGTHSLIPVRNHLSGGAFRLNRGQYNAVISFRLMYYFNRQTNE